MDLLTHPLPALLAATVLALAGCSSAAIELGDPPSTAGCTWSDTGRNDFFLLEPGYVLHLAEDAGDRLDVVITVEDETRVVAGVTTRVVTERESEAGELVEVSRNYYAVCQPRMDVFYFGEDVDDYEDGQVVAHGGEWLAGEDGAVPGLAMPGRAEVGVAAYMEYDPGDAIDRFEIVAVDETVTTPAGTFTGALKVKETNALEGDDAEYKWYGRGVGLLVDEGARLVSYGPAVAAA